MPDLSMPSEHLPPLTARSRNLVRFARHLPVETMDESFAADFSFRDAGSRFSVLKSPKTAPGPDECFGVFARDVRPIFQKLLGLKVRYVGLPDEMASRMSDYNAMNYYRSHVVEYFCHNGIEPAPPVEGDCTFWFAQADVLCVRYRLWNKSAVDVPVELTWLTEGDPGEDHSVEAIDQGVRFTNKQTVQAVQYASKAELKAADSLTFIAAGEQMQSEPTEHAIPARGMVTLRFAIRFAFNDEPLPNWPDALADDADLERVINETEQAYAALPDLPRETASHGDITLKGVGTLRSLRYLDRDIGGQPCMTIHAGKTGCAATWFWDTGATLPALGIMQERQTGQGALHMLTGGVQDNGKPAVTFENGEYQYGGYQMPLLTWGAGHFLAAIGDKQLIADNYAPLGRYVRHWLEQFMTDLGLVIHPPGMSCLDDAVRWHTGFPLEPKEGQPWHEQGWGRPRPDAFVCPDINGFLMLECQTLAAMADALGKSDEAAAWNKHADALAAAINQHLIEPDTQTYQDLHVETRAFTGLVNMASFIPIYAGIAPDDVATHSCRDYLLSPEHFRTPLPFPVIDRAHPTFRSGGFLYSPPAFPGSLVQHAYWRGRTWIHANNWYLGALWQTGLHDQAHELANVILTAVSRNEGIHETYDSLTGFGNGHPEFMWSSAAVVMMAHGFYTRPPVARFDA